MTFDIASKISTDHRSTRYLYVLTKDGSLETRNGLQYEFACGTACLILYTRCPGV